VFAPGRSHAEGAGVVRSVLKKKFGPRYPGSQRVKVGYTRIKTNYTYSLNVGRR
jgi:hypothetical protein